MFKKVINDNYFYKKVYCKLLDNNEHLLQELQFLLKKNYILAVKKIPGPLFYTFEVSNSKNFVCIYPENKVFVF